ELAEGGAALGELAPVAAAGIAGYELGSAIAPYVYGDKNLDGSPVVKYENVDDIDTNYKESWAYKINQWLDDLSPRSAAILSHGTSSRLHPDDEELARVAVRDHAALRSQRPPPDHPRARRG